jgi:hypothetical protein
LSLFSAILDSYAASSSSLIQSGQVVVRRVGFTTLWYTLSPLPHFNTGYFIPTQSNVQHNLSTRQSDVSLKHEKEQ